MKAAIFEITSLSKKIVDFGDKLIENMNNSFMAHSIEMQIPKTQVIKTDVEFIIKKDGKLLGRLNISQGNLEWIPSGNSVKKYRLRWGALDTIMRKYGKPGEIH